MPRLDWTKAAGEGLTADGRPETSLLFTSQLHLHLWAGSRFDEHLAELPLDAAFDDIFTLSAVVLNR